MSQRRAVTALTAREGRKEFGDTAPEINRQAQDRAQLNHDGIHLPVAIGEADVQQRFREAQMRGGTDRQKFGQAFDNTENEREQVIVQKSSESSTRKTRIDSFVNFVSFVAKEVKETQYLRKASTGEFVG